MNDLTRTGRAALFLCTVAIAMLLVAAVVDKTSPWLIAAPAGIGVAILMLSGRNE